MTISTIRDLQLIEIIISYRTMFRNLWRGFSAFLRLQHDLSNVFPSFLQFSSATASNIVERVENPLFSSSLRELMLEFLIIEIHSEFYLRNLFQR